MISYLVLWLVTKWHVILPENAGKVLFGMYGKSCLACSESLTWHVWKILLGMQ